MVGGGKAGGAGDDSVVATMSICAGVSFVLV
jgi:hypothetical protein